MELKDKDGVQIAELRKDLSFEDQLKLLGVPLSSVSRNTDGFQFLYNTIFRDLQSIQEENIDQTKGEQEFFVKKIMSFQPDGSLKKQNIRMNRKAFFEYIEQKFCTTIIEQKLISEGDTIILGYSGGTDCTILLDLLAKNKSKLPDFKIIAVTIGHLAGTNKREFITSFCQEREIEHLFVEDEEIIKRFDLKKTVEQTIQDLLNNEKQLAINFVQHAIKIMLEHESEKIGANKIMLGLERETMITSILSFYLSGKPLLGLYKKTDGKFTYIFPLMSLLKQEEKLYLDEKIKTYRHQRTSEIKKNKLDELHASDWRGSIMVLAGHLFDYFPGIDFYLENAFREIHNFYNPILQMNLCNNCKGSFIVRKNEKVCGVCKILAERGLLNEIRDA